jgi:ATP-dependent Clp protease ATP-binding subunit ClpA
MFERFSKDARAAVIGAQAEAKRLGHPAIGTEHLLLSLLRESNAAVLLRDCGLTAAGVEEAIDRLTPERPGTLGAADAAALRAIGIDLDQVRARIEENFGVVPPPPPPEVTRGWRFGLRRRAAEPEKPRPRPIGGHLPFVPRSKKVLELSLREALRLKHREITSEHLLLALLREGEGLAASVLSDAGVDFAVLRARTEAALRKAA